MLCLFHRKSLFYKPPIERSLVTSVFKLFPTNSHLSLIAISERNRTLTIDRADYALVACEMTKRGKRFNPE
jgi:hypothetical protein